MKIKSGDWVILSDEGIQLGIEEYGNLEDFDIKKQARLVVSVYEEYNEISIIFDGEEIDVDVRYYRLATEEEIRKQKNREKIVGIFHK